MNSVLTIEANMKLVPQIDNVVKAVKQPRRLEFSWRSTDSISGVVQSFEKLKGKAFTSAQHTGRHHHARALSLIAPWHFLWKA